MIINRNHFLPLLAFNVFSDSFQELREKIRTKDHAQDLVLGPNQERRIKEKEVKVEVVAAAEVEVEIGIDEEVKIRVEVEAQKTEVRQNEALFKQSDNTERDTTHRTREVVVEEDQKGDNGFCN